MLVVLRSEAVLVEEAMVGTDSSEVLFESTADTSALDVVVTSWLGSRNSEVFSASGARYR